MADIIKVEHLSYVYNPGLPTAVTALDDVSFTVEEGDFVGIIGATGSGKSTLITHMNGLNKPTSGKIYIDGRDLWADPEKIRDFRFLTGLVFQYPEYQLFEETCYKDIAFGPKNMGLDEAEIDAILLGRDSGQSDAVSQIVRQQAQEFVSDLLSSLRERMLELKSGKVIFTGGGAVLLRQQIEASDKVREPVFIEDIAANGRGYQLLYQAERMGGNHGR